MREIKFRAWNGDYMIDYSFGDWISFDGVPYTESFPKYNTPNIEIEKASHYQIMQYTGLKDKNGKEIYEGGIFIHPGTLKAVVVVYENGLGWGLRDVNGQWQGQLRVYANPIEIITGRSDSVCRWNLKAYTKSFF